jgi:GMP synthase (glutamine-hydrolysing)
MEAPIHPGSIVILDFGGQYAHLIARRVRESGAFSQILPAETPADKLKEVAGIILSGGPQSVYDKGAPQADPAILQLGIPVLGICYGHHWIAHVMGGEVKPGKIKEFGHTEIDVMGGSLFKDLPNKFIVWMSHGDEVVKMPEGFVAAASSGTCQYAAMFNETKNIYAVQFHLEVVHTQNGAEILKKFVDLCHAKPWSIEGFAQRMGTEVLKEVGDRRVFMLVSGGVDSTVAFTLLNEVLGPHRVQGLLIDTGMMRKNEVRNIKNAFDLLGIENLRVIDSSDEFFTNLKDVTEPEAKRKIIGDTFLAIQKRESDAMGLKLEEGWMLGQGTIYPDTIETGGTKHSDTIKTHHNRVEAVQKMIEAGLVIEPLKELYKDEVRKLGQELGLPKPLVMRHPFPGPGLGVRILCAGELELTRLRQGSSGHEIKDGKLQIEIPHKILPVRSVGVQGDGRTYRHAIALFNEQPTVITDKHRRLATSIPNKHHDINRVLLCTSHASAVEFSYTPGSITRERVTLLQEADSVVDEEMNRSGLYDRIWQFPVVLLPFGEKEGHQSIVLRPIESQEAMTANAVILPSDVLARMTERLIALPGVDMVFLDLTNKPPATIEWE